MPGASKNYTNGIVFLYSWYNSFIPTNRIFFNYSFLLCSENNFNKFIHTEKEFFIHNHQK